MNTATDDPDDEPTQAEVEAWEATLQATKTQTPPDLADIEQRYLGPDLCVDNWCHEVITDLIAYVRDLQKALEPAVDLYERHEGGDDSHTEWVGVRIRRSFFTDAIRLLRSTSDQEADKT